MMRFRRIGSCFGAARAAPILAFTVGAGLSVAAAAAERFNLPAGPGRDLVSGHCQICHDLQSVADSSGIRRGAWDAVLDDMAGFGLRISQDQRATILDYLGTYLGPNPPPITTAASAAAGAVDGAQVFDDNCSACHQPDGKGEAGAFPPLAGNPDLFLAPDFPAAVALNGIAGPIDVAGQPLDKVMPPYDYLSDDEIAAVVKHIRSAWGNDALRPAGFADLTAAEVAALRARPMTAAEVHAYRASLK